MKKIRNVIVLFLTFVMIMNLSLNVLANTTSISYSGTATEYYTLTVPSVLNPGKTSSVQLSGTWPTNRTVVVSTPSSLTLINDIDGSTKNVDIYFDGFEQIGNNLSSINASTQISVGQISNALFGTWSGELYYNISIIDNGTAPDIGEDDDEPVINFEVGNWLKDGVFINGLPVVYGQYTYQNLPSNVTNLSDSEGYITTKNNLYFVNNFGVTTISYIEDGVQYEHEAMAAQEMWFTGDVFDCNWEDGQPFFNFETGVLTIPEVINVPHDYFDETIGEQVYAGPAIPTYIRSGSIEYAAVLGLDNGEDILEVRLPKTIDSLDAMAFHHIYALKRIVVDEDNPYLKSIDNVVYSKDGTILHVMPDDIGITSFEVPDGVEIIDEVQIFHNCGLIELTLPTSLKEVRSYIYMDEGPNDYDVEVVNYRGTPEQFAEIYVSSYWMDCERLVDVLTELGVIINYNYQ